MSEYNEFEFSARITTDDILEISQPRSDGDSDDLILMTRDQLARLAKWVKEQPRGGQ